MKRPNLVDERELLTRRGFNNDYLLPRRPLVLRKAMRHIPAVGKWSVDFFATRFGAHHVPIDGLASGQSMRLDDYVNTLHSDDNKNAPLYMRNLLVFERFPELKKDFEMPWFTRPNWLESRTLGDFSGGSWRYWAELFLSGRGSRFPFVHMDPYYTHAWSLQLSGQKHFYLWAPIKNQHAQLLRKNINRMDPTPIDSRSDLPSLFKERQCFHLELNEGDLAFIPAGWWHTTETHDLSVTLGGNFVEASNWIEFKTLYQKRNPAHTFKQALGRKFASIVAPRLFRIRDALPHY